MSEEIPVHEKIKVLNSETLFKTDEWWKAITLQEAFGNKEVAIYLWRKRGEGEWKRKQKFTVKSVEKWDKIKGTMDEYIKEL